MVTCMALENQDWGIRTTLFKATKSLSATMGTVKLMIWWQLGDLYPELRECCGTMAKLVCGASKLKSDSYLYKQTMH